MSTDKATSTHAQGVGSTEGLGQDDPERAAFANWCRANGHGELDDMLTPLDRSLRALMWPVWQAGVATERQRLKNRLNAAEGMAGCMDLLRHDLERMGVVPAGTAPMFMTEAVVAALQKAQADERTRMQRWACRKEWEDVNDPPCHPGDADWKPCARCAGPND